MLLWMKNNLTSQKNTDQSRLWVAEMHAKMFWILVANLILKAYPTATLGQARKNQWLCTKMGWPWVPYFQTQNVAAALPLWDSYAWPHAQRSRPGPRHGGCRGRNPHRDHKRACWIWDNIGWGYIYIYIYIYDCIISCYIPMNYQELSHHGWFEKG